MTVQDWPAGWIGWGHPLGMANACTRGYERCEDAGPGHQNLSLRRCRYRSRVSPGYTGAGVPLKGVRVVWLTRVGARLSGESGRTREGGVPCEVWMGVG